MIYAYEHAILRYFNACIKDLKLATYASDQVLLEAMSQVRKYPSMYFTRNDPDMKSGRLVQVREKDGSFMNLSPYNQVYRAHVLVENQETAFRYCNQLRAQWSKCSKVWVTYQPIGTFPVQIRLHNIKVTDVRLPNDTKGACRSVEVEWSSVLFLDDSAEKLSYPTIDSYQLILGDGVNFTVVAKGKFGPGEEVIVPYHGQAKS